MMDKETASEMIQAKALGCLEINDRKILDEYINLGGEFPWKEYGEYQNLAALLPIILEIEAPQISVKDKVARRIYDAIAELKAKKDLRSGETDTGDDLVYPETTVLGDQIFSAQQGDNEKKNEIQDSESIPDTEGNLSEEETIPGISGNLSDEFSIQEPEIIKEGIDSLKLSDETGIKIESEFPEVKDSGEISTKIISTEEPEDEIKPSQPSVVSKPVQSKYRSLLEEKSKHKPAEEEIPLVKEKFEKPEIPKKKNPSGVVVDIIIYILLLAAIAFVYLKLSSDIDELKKEVNEIKQNTDISFNYVSLNNFYLS